MSELRRQLRLARPGYYGIGQSVHELGLMKRSSSQSPSRGPTFTRVHISGVEVIPTGRILACSLQLPPR